MTVRAKFQLTYITQNCWSETSRTLKFTPQYDTSIPEDARFSKATTSGCFEITCDNPAALEKLEIGKFYYFDITPA